MATIMMYDDSLAEKYNLQAIEKQVSAGDYLERGGWLTSPQLAAVVGLCR